MNHQESLVEIRSLQLINKLLYNELGVGDTKSEVMVDAENMAVKGNEYLNNGQPMEDKRESNFVNEEALHVTNICQIKKKGGKSYYDEVRQSRVSNKTVCNPNDKLEAQCTQGLTHVSQDIDGKRCFKIPTLKQWSNSNGYR